MPNIGSQFVSEMGGLAANTAREAVKASTDVVTGVVETLATGGTNAPVIQTGDQSSAEKMTNNAQDPQAIAAQKRQMENRRRFNQVKQELEEYRQRQAQQQQEQQVEKKKEMEELQQKQSEKARKEQEYIAQIQRQYSGANEGAKQKG